MTFIGWWSSKFLTKGKVFLKLWSKNQKESLKNPSRNLPGVTSRSKIGKKMYNAFSGHMNKCIIKHRSSMKKRDQHREKNHHRETWSTISARKAPAGRPQVLCGRGMLLSKPLKKGRWNINTIKPPPTMKKITTCHSLSPITSFSKSAKWLLSSQTPRSASLSRPSS